MRKMRFFFIFAHFGLYTDTPYTDWFHHSFPPVSWCVVGFPAHYGCRRIIQVDATHWWWMRRFPPLCKRFEYPEKRYIHVTNYYYYYKYLPFFFSPFFVNLKGFIIGKLVWLYCSDNLKNSKTNMTKNRDKIVIFLKKIVILYFFHIAHPYLDIIRSSYITFACYVTI